jgi:hypothetical protein
MADLIVDYELLESCSSKLSDIVDFLDGLEGRVDGCDKHVWGVDDITDAMHTFAHNWSYHREKLQDLIEKGSEKFEKSKETFAGNDESLAKTLTSGAKGHTA